MASPFTQAKLWQLSPLSPTGYVVPSGHRHVPTYAPTPSAFSTTTFSSEIWPIVIINFQRSQQTLL